MFIKFLPMIYSCLPPFALVSPLRYSFLNTNCRIIGILSNRRRIDLIFVLFSAIISSFLEVISIGAVIPFLEFLFSRSEVEKSALLEKGACLFRLVLLTLI